MSQIISTLTIEMAANVARLQKDMARAQNVVGSASAKMMAAARTATAALGALGLAIGAIAAIKGFASLIQGAIDAADETSKLAQKAGLATEEVAGLSLAFKQGGVESEVMLKALSKLAVGVADGNEALKVMGIETKNAEGNFKSSREILASIAEKFEGYADGIEKTALAVEIFGKSGADLIPVLNAGAKELEKYDKIAKQLGLTVDEVTAKHAEKFNDTMELIGFTVKGLATRIMKDVIPGFELLATRFFDSARESNLLKSAAEFLTGPIKALQIVALGAAAAFEILGAYFGSYAKAFMEFASGNFQGAWDAIQESGEKVLEIGRKTFEDFQTIWQGAAGVVAEIEEAGKKKPPTLANGKATAEYQKMIDAANDYVNAIIFETEALTMNNIEKETAIAQQKLLSLGLKEGTAEWQTYSEAVIKAIFDKEAMTRLVEERKKIDDKAIADRLKAEEKYADEIKQIQNQIGQSLTDAIMEGGVNAKDFLIKMFKTMILRPMLQPIITGMVGMFTGGAASAMTEGAAGAATGGGVGSSMSLMSMASSMKSAYEMVTGGFNGIGSTVGSFVQGLSANAAAAEGATALMASTSEAASGVAMAQIEAANASAAASGAIASSVATAMAGIGAGIGIGQLISGDKSLVGGNSMYTVGGGVAAGAAIGSIVPGIGTAIGAVVGGIVGGLANQFGNGPKKIEDYGISGSISSSGSSLKQFSDWKKEGGWFSKDKTGTETAAVAAKVSKYIDSSVAATAIAVKQYANVLGLPAKGISDFVFQVKQSLDGLTPEEAEKAITKVLASYGDALTAKVVEEIGVFIREGEDWGATLSRLATSLVAVNGIFDTLNITLMDASMYGADAASKLADAFGGLDKFIAATDAYYQNFYSAQERADKTTQNLSKVFNELGLAMPSTNAQFRSMVEAARAAGNDTLFANLIKLAPAFSNLKNSLASLVDAAFQNLQAAIQSEQKAAIDAIEKRKAIAQAQKDVASENIAALGSIFDYLTSQIDDLSGAVNSAQSAAAGASFIRNAVEASNNTGYLPDQKMLETAVSAVRAGMESTNYATAYQQKLAQMQLAAQLSDLKGVAEEQKTTAELQLEVAQKTIDDLNAQAASTNAYYENQLIYAQTQINELRNVNGSVMTVAGAMASLGAAIEASKMQAAASAGGGNGGSGSGGSDSSRTGQINSLYQEILGRSAEAGGLNAWNGSGLSIDQIREGIMSSPEARGFATGGYYPGGLAMVGEQGPEMINFNRPGQVYTAGQTSEIMSGNGLAAEIQGLRNDIQAQSRSNAQIQIRTTKVLERWDGSGLPTARVEA